MQRFYITFRHILDIFKLYRLPDPVKLMVSHLEQGVAPAYRDIAAATRFYSANPDFEPVRRRFLAACGWSTPSQEAVELIASHSRRIVELGAGNGTWAMLLSNAGVDVKPTDTFQEYETWGRDFDQSAHRQWAVCENLAGERAFRKYQRHHDVLIAWPPQQETYPLHAASHMTRGQLMFFIGSHRSEVMATPEFFDTLEQRFDKLDERVLPHWYGTSDTLTVWRKR